MLFLLLQSSPTRWAHYGMSRVPGMVIYLIPYVSVDVGKWIDVIHYFRDNRMENNNRPQPFLTFDLSYQPPDQYLKETS